MADYAFGFGRGGDHRLQVDAGGDAHVLDHSREFLGGDVPGRARRVGASAEAADGRIEVGNAEFEGREDVGQAGAAGVVEVQVQARLRVGIAERADQRPDPGRGGHAGGVAERCGVGPVGDGPPGDGYRAGHRDVALVRAAPGSGHDHLHGGAALVGAGDDLGDLVQRLLGGPVDVLAVMRLRRGNHRLELGEPGVQRPQRAAQVGH